MYSVIGKERTMLRVETIRYSFRFAIKIHTKNGTKRVSTFDRFVDGILRFDRCGF